MLYFGAPHPQISRLKFDSIPDSLVIVDPQSRGRDTIALWFNVPAANLPDTLHGEIEYMKHDSINRLVPAVDKLKLTWTKVESKEEAKEREKLEKERQKAEENGEEWVEPEVENPFKFKMPVSGSVNPEEELTIDFDYPLVQLDSTALLLTFTDKDKTMTDIPVRMERDTANMCRWHIRAAEWKENGDYTLTIPEGAITDVAGYKNDSIIGKYTVQKASEFAKVKISIRGREKESKYIVQLLDSGGKLKQEKRNVTTGEIEFNYVTPGEVKFRVIEDANGNGEWDSGNVVERRQPERAEMFVNEDGEELFATKANWDIEFSIDMNKLFAPVTMQSLSRMLDDREAERLRRAAEEAKKNPKKSNNGHNHNHGSNNRGGLGGGLNSGGLNGSMSGGGFGGGRMGGF